MHPKDAEAITETFNLLHRRQQELATVIEDMYKFLVLIKEERDKERIPERIKALEEAYGEFLMLGSKNEANKG